MHGQMRRALRTDAECDDRDRAHQERWQFWSGKSTVWSKEADVQWCQKKLQTRADQRVLWRKQREGAIKSVYDQMARACKTDAECDDVDRAHRARWGEPNGLGAGMLWLMEADVQWCQARVEQRKISRTVSRAA